MTTSSQQTVLTGAELACLRDVAEGRPRAANDTDIEGLVAKGMLAADDASRHPGSTMTPPGAPDDRQAMAVGRVHDRRDAGEFRDGG